MRSLVDEKPHDASFKYNGILSHVHMGCAVCVVLECARYAGYVDGCTFGDPGESRSDGALVAKYSALAPSSGFDRMKQVNALGPGSPQI